MFFHRIFSGIFLAMLGLRTYYRWKAVRARGRVAYREDPLNIAARVLFGAVYIGGILAYIPFPGWLSWAALPLPAWARWVGAGLSAATLGLLWWVQWALGAHYDTTLHTHAEHRLVTRGPYRWVRHPMYTTLFLQGLGLLLLSANAAVGLPWLTALLIVVALRVGREEALMLEVFGEAYRDYMRRTGRFLPRLRGLEEGR